MTALQPRVRKADRRALIDLTRPGTDRGKVVTIYIDLDPSTFATAQARESEVSSLLSEAENIINEASQDQKKRLRQDVDLLRDFLTADFDWAKDAHAVAAFCASNDGLFEVFKLPVSVEAKVFIGDVPLVGPLAEILSGEHFCVSLINRTTARIFIGPSTALIEVEEIEDEVHGQHSQGGWSQARYQRSIEEDVKDHLKGVADALLTLYKRRAFDRLVIATSEELWPQLKGCLNNELLQRLEGRIPADIQNASVEEVQDELEQLLTIRTNEEEKQLLSELRMRLGRGERAACGVEDVLEALNGRRVDTVLVDQLPGTAMVCRSCGWVVVTGDQCPVDGSQLEATDMEGEIQRLATETDAILKTMQYHPDLLALGGVAALLRF